MADKTKVMSLVLKQHQCTSAKIYFLPRLPRVLFRSPVLTPRIANSHDGNKACPRYFSMVGPKPSDRKTFPPLKSLFWGYLV